MDILLEDVRLLAYFQNYKKNKNKELSRYNMLILGYVDNYWKITLSYLLLIDHSHRLAM